MTLQIDRPDPTMNQADAMAAGRDLRRSVPRSSHAHYERGGRDPLAILAEQNESRLPHLVPIRMGRMSATPFGFFRGAAAVMASDLARGASTGIRIVICGDAHYENFGFFASPERSTVFDMNDFDEAGVAPWEWDVKRLVTSAIIGGRSNGLGEEECRDAAMRAAAAYRVGLRRLMGLDALERYFFRLGRDRALLDLPDLSPEDRQRVEGAARQASKRTSMAFIEKATVQAPDGTRRFIENPPTLARLNLATRDEIVRLWDEYRHTVPADIALLLSQFTPTDGALRVVGVGSVGTRCHVLLLTGPAGESFVLQIKEAQRSVLQTFGGMPPSEPALPVDAVEGYRVVSNQRILQAVSDPFLGYIRFAGRDYYVRQFRDRKGSINAANLDAAGFARLMGACGILLARGHAQSPGAAMIAGYLGNSATFDRAVTEWSLAYAAQSLEDHDLLHAAIVAGTVPATFGV